MFLNLASEYQPNTEWSKREQKVYSNNSSCREGGGGHALKQQVSFLNAATVEVMCPSLHLAVRQTFIFVQKG